MKRAVTKKRHWTDLSRVGIINHIKPFFRPKNRVSNHIKPTASATDDALNHPLVSSSPVVLKGLVVISIATFLVQQCIEEKGRERDLKGASTHI